MRYRRLLTSVICVIGVFALMGTAHARLAWYCCSDLEYEGTFKGPVDTILEIDLVNFTVQASCFNIQTGDFNCQPGVGNGGGYVITAYPTAVGDKETGTITVKGTLNLNKFDHHWSNSYYSGADPYSGYELEACPSDMTADELNDPDFRCHVHLCWPYDNKNKFEFVGSAYISSIDVTYTLTNLKNDKSVLHGTQHCNWTGTIDPVTCLPTDHVIFDCPIDLESKK